MVTKDERLSSSGTQNLNITQMGFRILMSSMTIFGVFKIHGVSQKRVQLGIYHLVEQRGFRESYEV